MPTIYMIRSGDFGTDFGAKLFLALAALGLVTWDLARQRRRDYLWVLLAGTWTWTLVEAAMQAQGTRVLVEASLFGAPLPRWLHLPLQGMAEGGAVAILGLFLGDRLLAKATRWRALAGLAALSVAVILSTLGQSGTEPASLAANPASRRDMFTPQALGFLGAMVTLSILAWWRRPGHRPRLAAMTAVMLIVATAWTLAEVAVGTRGIQVPGAAPGTYSPAPGGIAAAALTYDVLVEIVLAYVPFFAVPAMLGWARAEPLPMATAAGSARQAG
ncbi:MAG: hypothetical protein RBU30_10270 [Polyangia bacterium]|jgi:hypothetical protein|nr:hypothetical protein [Polyangia bacterium]